MAFAFVFTYQDNHLVTGSTLVRPKANDDKPITSALHQQHLLKQQTTPDPDQSRLLRNAFLQSGGAEEDRTPDLLRARQALSQLSYGPIATSVLLTYGHGGPSGILRFRPLGLAVRATWWAWEELNLRPRPYQGRALTT